MAEYYVIARDLALTMEGRIDGHAIPTRRRERDTLVLHDAPRPDHYADWHIERNVAKG